MAKTKAVSEAAIEQHADAGLIESLGGTAAVAKLCRVAMPSVSNWKRSGIPSARRDFLALLRPDLPWGVSPADRLSPPQREAA